MAAIFTICVTYWDGWVADGLLGILGCDNDRLLGFGEYTEALVYQAVWGLVVGVLLGINTMDFSFMS